MTPSMPIAGPRRRARGKGIGWPTCPRWPRRSPPVRAEPEHRRAAGGDPHRRDGRGAVGPVPPGLPRSPGRRGVGSRRLRHSLRVSRRGLPVPGGWAANRLGRQRSLTLFTLAAAGGYALYLGTHWAWVIAGTLLVMAWDTLTLPSLFAAVGDNLPPQESGPPGSHGKRSSGTSP